MSLLPTNLNSSIFQNEKKDKLIFASTPMESFECLKTLHKFLEEKKPVHDHIDSHTLQLSQLENLHQGTSNMENFESMLHLTQLCDN